MSETRDEYASRHRARDLDLVDRARRAQEAINSLGAGPDSLIPARYIQPVVRNAVTPGAFSSWAEELIAEETPEEDSERVTQYPRVSDGENWD